MANDSRFNNNIVHGDEIDLLALAFELIRGIRINWRWILLVVSLTATIVYTGTKMFFTPQYTAFSSFTVSSANIYGYTEATYNTRVAGILGKVFPYLLTNDVLLELVAEDMGTETVPGFVRAEVVEDTNLITLSATATDPELAYRLLQAVIKNYPQVSKYVIGDINLTLLDDSGIPTKISNAANARRNALLGMMICFMACMAYLSFAAMTRNWVSSEDDLKKVVNAQVIASVPLVHVKHRRNSTEDEQMLIDRKGMEYYFVEAIRALRTRVENASVENGIKSILITSAVAGEGKTTVAVNLAVALAKKERKVILLDLDLRNPSVVKLINLEKQGNGIYDLLEGTNSFDEVRSNYAENENLVVLPGIEAIANPTATLGKDSLKDLIDKCKRMADFVIIDTPPSGIVSDASIIARHTDGGIYVVRQEYARVSTIREGLDILVGSGMQMMGCVLNNASSGMGSGYGYGYGYGYGRYGYGYGRYGRYGRYGYGRYGKYGYGQNEDSKDKP